MVKKLRITKKDYPYLKELCKSDKEISHQISCLYWHYLIPARATYIKGEELPVYMRAEYAFDLSSVYEQIKRHSELASNDFANLIFDYFNK